MQEAVVGQKTVIRHGMERREVGVVQSFQTHFITALIPKVAFDT